MLASRRDGSPFLNLLMVAPLFDCHGVLRYFVGAQVDVTQVLLDGAGMDSLAPALGHLPSQPPDGRAEGGHGDGDGGDVFRELTELFNDAEIETARRFGGRMHSGRRRPRREGPSRERDGPFRERDGRGRSRVILKEGTPPPPAKAAPPSSTAVAGAGAAEAGAGTRAETTAAETAGAARGTALKGVYQNYLLVRPYPSLRILFTSPSLRTPGIHQLHFMHKVGGSARVRDELHEALRVGKGVTAKVLWLTSRPGHCHPTHGCHGGASATASGRERWVHCTPLLDATGDVGVWMVIVVDPPGGSARRQMREAMYQLQSGYSGSGGDGGDGCRGAGAVAGDASSEVIADNEGTAVGVGHAEGEAKLDGHYRDDAPPSSARPARFNVDSRRPGDSGDSDSDGGRRSEIRTPSRAAPPPPPPVPTVPTSLPRPSPPPPPPATPPSPATPPAEQSPMFKLGDYIPPRKSSRHQTKPAQSVKKS